MGNAQASEGHAAAAPLPDSTCDATLYYFGGRGMADQVRWMLAATKVTFSQTLVSDRAAFLSLLDCGLLPFQQIPVLQIDGQVLAQSQAMVRYLARRADMAGSSTLEGVQMDMLAESVSEMLGHLVGAPFQRCAEGGGEREGWAEKAKVVGVKWSRCALRLESVLQRNSTTNSTGSSDGGVVFLVGSSLSYVDVLAAHLLTWAVEELGESALEALRLAPRLVDLQRHVLSLPHMAAFICSEQYFPLGDQAYVKEVQVTLGRVIN